MDLSRRNFMQAALLGGIALSGGAALSAVGTYQRRPSMLTLPPAADLAGLAPSSTALKSQSLALGRLFPALLDPDAKGGPFIANTLSSDASFAGHIRQGEPGNSVFLRRPDARAIIPWTPVFIRETNHLLQLPSSVTRHIDCSDLLVMNESSARYPVFGNKARKYEFLLPNLKWSGAKR